MSEPIVVEYGNQPGGGFTAHVDPQRGRAPDLAFQHAAQELLGEAIPQPPDDARDSGRFPVWGLQCVEVDGRGAHWCFTVQGRGGPFGSAGSCQFLFVRGDEDPADVWATGVAMVRPDGKLGHGPSGVHRLAPRGEHLVGPLTALLNQDDTVVLPGRPDEVAAVIGGLVRVLPFAAVRERVWTTYRLRVPVLDKRPTATGHWPAELAGEDSAVSVRRWLDSTAPAAPVHRGPRTADAIHWLARLGEDVGRSAPHRHLPGLRDLVDVVVREELGITAADVPALVAAADERLRDGDGPELTRRWAGREPETAIRTLMLATRRPSWLRALLFDGLLTAHRTAPGRNPARFPPTPGPAGWHYRLGEMVVERFPDREDRLAFARAELLADGRPLATRDLVLRHRDWLVAIGLPPDDPSTGILPVDVEDIAESLSYHGSLTDAQRAHLAAVHDPAAEVRRVLGHLGHVSPDRAACLVTAVDDGSAKQVVEDVLRHNERYASDVEDWLEQLMAADLPESTWNHVAESGVRHLTAHGFTELPETFVVQVLQHWADTKSSGPLAQRVLGDAVSHLCASDVERREAHVPDVVEHDRSRSSWPIAPPRLAVVAEHGRVASIPDPDPDLDEEVDPALERTLWILLLGVLLVVLYLGATVLFDRL